jgi:hypothetical protein
MKKAKVALACKLAMVLHRMWLARIIHEGQGLRSADVREGGAWGAIGGVG